MPTATRYAAEKTEHGLLVRDVVLAVEGDTGRGYSLTIQNFQMFKQTFERRTAKGQVGAFVRLRHDGPRIGKIERLDVRGGELIGDILVEKKFDKDAAVANAVGADDLTDLSITFSREHGTLVDVSLLPDTFGQLHEKLPPLLVNLKEEFGVEASDLESLSIKGVTAMPTIEELSALLDKKLKPLNDRIEKLEVVKTPAPAKPADSTPSVNPPELENAAREAYSADFKAMNETMRALEIGAQVDSLTGLNGGASEKQRAHWREQLEHFGDNKTARMERFNWLSSEIKREKLKSGPKLEPEGSFSRLSLDAQLREEFKNLGGFERFGITEHEYVQRTRGLADDLR